MSKCLSCGTANEPDASFCLACGETLSASGGSLKCPSCGTGNTRDVTACLGCGEVFDGPLCLLADNGHKFSLNIGLRVNQAWASAIGEEARVWDRSCQMEFRRRDGRWYVSPNLQAPNDTLFNGDLLDEETELKPGDVIAVGRASKGIVKTPLTVTPSSS